MLFGSNSNCLAKLNLIFGNSSTKYSKRTCDIVSLLTLKDISRGYTCFLLFLCVVSELLIYLLGPKSLVQTLHLPLHCLVHLLPPPPHAVGFLIYLPPQGTQTAILLGKTIHASRLRCLFCILGCCTVIRNSF